MDDTKKKHHHGHRDRVRKRFLQQGLEGFQDHEALELLLLFIARQKDIKPVAKELVARLGSFKNVLDASPQELEAVDGVGPTAAALIHFIKQAAARYLQQTSRTHFSLDSPQALIQYCIVSMGAEPNEKFRVICLDGSFAIIGESDRTTAHTAPGGMNKCQTIPHYDN
jgi:DNA repair protein RadC